MKKLLVILGPTATGKTDLGLDLAKKFNGELVACDSRQVYQGLDIGTGKRPSENSKFEFRNSRLKKLDGRWVVYGVNIWMYDVIDPKKQYNVSDYVKDTNNVIKNITIRGKLPIIVGGTGLYLKALLGDLPDINIPVDKSLRQKLENLPKDKLQKKLRQIDINKWESMNESDRQNPRRLIRAIEISISSLRAPKGRGNLKTRLLRRFAPRNDVLKIGLTAPREVLYKSVDARVISRMPGMIAEAESLYEKGLTIKRMTELGLEYSVLADYLAGKITTKENFVKILQYQIHGYVRRQQTWFKKEKDINWFNITDNNLYSRIENLVREWYDIDIKHA